MLGYLSMYPLKTVILKKYFIDILNYLPQYVIEDININTYYAPQHLYFSGLCQFVFFDYHRPVIIPSQCKGSHILLFPIHYLTWFLTDIHSDSIFHRKFVIIHYLLLSFLLFFPGILVLIAL